MIQIEQPSIVFLGLGSNLGGKEKNICTAIDLLKKRCKILKKSSIYRTEPVGYKEQDWFFNCVIKAETHLSPTEFLFFIRSIETALGRKRLIKDGPRTMDIDILFYDDAILDEKVLKIPHPRLHERQFVLVPFSEIEKSFIHPLLQKTIQELKEDCKDNSTVIKQTSFAI